MKSIIHCKIDAITKLLAAPLIPKMGVNTKIDVMKLPAKPILPTKIILAFSWPKNFELKINDKVAGITAKLITWIAEIASSYSGKINGMMYGGIEIPKIVIRIEVTMAMNLIFVFWSPTESWGNVYW